MSKPEKLSSNKRLQIKDLKGFAPSVVDSSRTKDIFFDSVNPNTSADVFDEVLAQQEQHDEELKKHELAISAVEERAGEVVKKVEEQRSSIESTAATTKEELKTLKSELTSDRYRTIEVLAFFVAFFTFASVEFQFFARLNSLWHVLSLSLIIFGMVTYFVVLLSRIAHGPEDRSGKKVDWRKALGNSKLLIGSIAMILIGIGMAAPFLYQESIAASTKQSYENNKQSTCTILAQESVMQMQQPLVVQDRALDTYERLRCGVDGESKQ